MDAEVSQLKVAMVPEDAVKYWRQSSSGALILEHSYWVVFICHLRVVEVVPVSMSILMVLQASDAGT